MPIAAFGNPYQKPKPDLALTSLCLLVNFARWLYLNVFLMGPCAKKPPLKGDLAPDRQEGPPFQTGSAMRKGTGPLFPAQLKRGGFQLPSSWLRWAVLFAVLRGNKTIRWIAFPNTPWTSFR